MTQDNVKYTILTYVFLIITILIVFFVSTKLYTSYTEITYNKNILEQKFQESEKKYKELSDIKSKIKDDDKEMNKFLINFSEDELTSYFYNYSKNNPSVVINSISLSEWKLNDFWFKEWSINLSVSFDWEENMLKMLNFIINSDKYNFFITSFDYNFWAKWPMEINIPIKVLYK